MAQPKTEPLGLVSPPKTMRARAHAPSPLTKAGRLYYYADYAIVVKVMQIPTILRYQT